MSLANNHTILVLGSNEYRCWLLLDRLSEEDYEVYATLDHVLIHQLINKHRPDLIIWDMLFRTTPDYAFWQDLRDQHKSIKLVAVSVRPGSLSEEISNLFDYQIPRQKRSDLIELIKVVKTALEKTKKSRKLQYT